MPKLVFDIETIGEDFDKLDETSQEVLTHWIRKEIDNKEEYERDLSDLKDGLGFSPLTGEVVVIGHGFGIDLDGLPEEPLGVRETSLVLGYDAEVVPGEAPFGVEPDGNVRRRL